MTTTAQPPAAPATMPLLDLVRSLGCEVYLDGVQYCPDCMQVWGSERCTCRPAAEPDATVRVPQAVKYRRLTPARLDPPAKQSSLDEHFAAVASLFGGVA